CACPDRNRTGMRKRASWNVYVAEAVNGHAAAPAFAQFTASDHVIHRGTVSTGGLGGGADRSLADFFQVALDGQHRVNVSFADDHVVSPLCTRRSPGHCGDDDAESYRVGVPYFTRQLKANGQLGYPFNFSACDLSPLGTGIASFSIAVTGPEGFYYQKSGKFTSGFVKLHARL